MGITWEVFSRFWKTSPFWNSPEIFLLIDHKLIFLRHFWKFTDIPNVRKYINSYKEKILLSKSSATKQNTYTQVKFQQKRKVENTTILFSSFLSIFVFCIVELTSREKWSKNIYILYIYQIILQKIFCFLGGSIVFVFQTSLLFQGVIVIVFQNILLLQGSIVLVFQNILLLQEILCHCFRY